MSLDDIERRLQILEDTVGELLSALAEEPSVEPEDRLAAGFARFMSRSKIEDGGNAERT